MKPALAQSVDLGVCTSAEDVVTALAKYISNERWCFQQKLDGHRVLAEVVAGVVRPYNRSGDIRPAYLPAAIAQCLQETLTGHWILDGELVGDTYWVFDLLQALGVVTPTTPCNHRLHVLEEFFTVWTPPPCIQVVPRACDADSKIALIRKVFASGGEGLIFRDMTRAYHPGKRSTDILKAKFTKTVDCVVMKTKVDGKDNLVLGVYRGPNSLVGGEEPVEIGHCTALSGDGPKVRKGDVVEVTYLTWSGSRLIQPTRPLLRTDKPPQECLMDQLVIGATKVAVL